MRKLRGHLGAEGGFSFAIPEQKMLVKEGIRESVSMLPHTNKDHLRRTRAFQSDVRVLEQIWLLGE